MRGVRILKRVDPLSYLRARGEEMNAENGEGLGELRRHSAVCKRIVPYDRDVKEAEDPIPWTRGQHLETLPGRHATYFDWRAFMIDVWCADMQIQVCEPYPPKVTVDEDEEEHFEDVS